MTEQPGPQARALDGIADFRAALVDLLRGARRELCIFSEQLARPLYHDAEVVQALSEFARSSRFARVRILIRESESLAGRSHRTLALAQRLSSRIEIRRVEGGVDTPDWEFAIADGRRLLRCDDRQLWLGSYQPQAQVRARELLDAFERDWPLASTDPNLRRLSL